MKIQLDTTSKTIKIEENVLLSKLITTLNGLLPNKEWKKYTLETNTTITHWTAPYIIKEIPVYPRPYYPSYPWYYLSTGDTSGLMKANKITAEYKSDNSLMAKADYSLKAGVFNVEVK